METWTTTSPKASKPQLAFCKASAAREPPPGSVRRSRWAPLPVAVIRRDGVIVAFANLWPTPDRHELSIDLMRYGPEAPREVMEHLFLELMLWGKAEGYRRFDLGMAPKPKLGDVYPSVIGPLLYSFDQFQIAPRSLADLGGDPGDTAGGTTGDTTGGGMTDPIYDSQMGKYQLMDPVTVEGVIATSGLTFKQDGFFVQDPNGGEYSGIFVYIGGNKVAVAPGDVLTIAGTYDEFFTYSEIKIAKPADIIKTGTAPVPAPAVVTSAEVATGGAKAENYEGVLVQVKNAKVSDAVDMNGEFIVDTKLRVDDLFFAKVDWVAPKIGDTFTTITGPLAYTFDNFKVAPRTLADLVK